MSKRKKHTPPPIRTQGDGDVPQDLRTPGEIKLEFKAGHGYSWPKDVPRIGRWHVRTPIPCENKKCNLVYMVGQHGTTQAVRCMGVKRTGSDGIAHLQCRACGERFKLPISLV